MLKEYIDILNTPEGKTALDVAKSQSPILNSHFDSGMEQQVLKTKSGCGSLLIELLGTNNSGKYRDKNGDIQTATIAYRTQQIKEIESAFDREKQRLASEGRRVPDTMASHMMERYRRQIAKLAVNEIEVEIIRAELTKLENIDKRDVDSRVLMRGPMGTARIAPTPGYPHGRIIQIDGQTVEPDADGIMRISDKRSPYNGMKVCDYIDFVCKPWLRERSRLQAEERERAEKAGPGTPYRRNLRPPNPPWPDCVPKSEMQPKKRKRA